jgi:hypothetical protein
LDLAGLGEGGALAALAVLDRGVVAVVGADARAWVLATSYTVQCSTGGLCRDRRAGGPFRSEDQTVAYRSANRPYTGMVTSTAFGATGGRAASP